MIIFETYHQILDSVWLRISFGREVGLSVHKGGGGGVTAWSTLADKLHSCRSH